ncbi:Protein kinase-like domain [Cordyceps militaris CM01]|uniref:Protein kinase-like domain n=1 Tax=Cordyceps militaris (strain CM01) TaxID=983644 RepID=G3JBN8_CORMM|nr:Protein kinase-like domain [Cordyceps militaris CM01]EGX93664.1 Protein kinase-like domain [Cordyceps militaris CM01]
MIKRGRVSALLRRVQIFQNHTSSRGIIPGPIEEELLPGNRLHLFHQTQPGQVLDGRFKIIVKLGYGASSTVWLAENLQFTKSLDIPRYVSIKIAALDIDKVWETRISKMIAMADPSHDGLSFLRIPIDEFRLETPSGVHGCLVYTPMRTTLFQLQRTLKRQRLAPPLFKFFLYCLLEAVDYLHTKVLPETDIKDDNIMVTIESDTVLPSFIKSLINSGPLPHSQNDQGRSTYLSYGDFGPLKGHKLLPQLADFNLACPGLINGHGHLLPIQSHRFRAPEVLLGCPWSYSADIWNIGLLMWNLLEDVSLFGRPAGNDGEYDAHVHLAQMVSLMGDPPEELIAREQLFRTHRLEKPIENQRGQECNTMNEYWGGPFFNSEGRIFREDLINRNNALADTVTELMGDEKIQFLDLASSMLQWMPEKRKTGGELLQHPFFAQIRERRARWEATIPSAEPHDLDLASGRTPGHMIDSLNPVFYQKRSKKTSIIAS